MTAFAKSWRDDKARNSSLRFRASHLRHQWLEAAGERRQRFPTTSGPRPQHRGTNMMNAVDWIFLTIFVGFAIVAGLRPTPDRSDERNTSQSKAIQIKAVVRG